MRIGVNCINDIAKAEAYWRKLGLPDAVSSETFAAWVGEWNAVELRESENMAATGKRAYNAPFESFLNTKLEELGYE